MKGKKSGIGTVVVVTTALGVGLAFGADPNQGAIDIQSFLNAPGAIDNPIRVVRYSIFDQRMSSGFPPFESHNVTSYFGGQDNKYDERPADNNEPFLIRLLQHETTTENKTSKLKFSFPYYPDYTFGDKPIVFESNSIPYGPVADIRRAMALAPSSLSRLNLWV